MSKNKEIKEVYLKNVQEYPNIFDLFNEDEIDDELKSFKKNKNLEPFTYLTKKQFENLQEIHSVRVIGNVRLRKKFKRDKYEETENGKLKQKENSSVIGCCYIKHSDKYRRKHPLNDYDCTDEEYIYEPINIYKPKNVSCIGYAYVGGDSFVKIESEKYFLFILLVMLLLGALIFSLVSLPSNQPNNPEYENGEEYIGGSEEDFETNIQLDFTSYYKLTEKSPSIELSNSENNKYALQYDIYLIKPEDVDKKQLLKSTGGENQYLYIDSNNNGICEEGETVVDELIYSSKLIKPGSHPAVDEIYKKLPEGRYYLVFNIKVLNLDGTELKVADNGSVNSGFQAVTTTVDVIK